MHHSMVGGTTRDHQMSNMKLKAYSGDRHSVLLCELRVNKGNTPYIDMLKRAYGNSLGQLWRETRMHNVLKEGGVISCQFYQFLIFN